jgi:enterochelin esterase-like enzyme
MKQMGCAAADVHLWALVVLLATGAVCADSEAAADLGPIVTHSGRAPTGYMVTFRLSAPAAKRVQIRGEWYFERPRELQQIASTPHHTVETPGLLPADWRPGDVPIAYPNSTAGNWPVIDMRKEPDGVWTFMTPLPSGVFSYGYYVDCEGEDVSECTQISDPGNPPWNQKDGITFGSIQRMSQVYVPSDPTFDTVDYDWQASNDEPGRITHVTYQSPGHLTPAEENYLVVYTPPDYDERRANRYPTLYLNHGGGGNEMDWSTQGVLGNIMDNLIDVGEVQPMLVVMANAAGYPTSADNAAFRSDLVNNIIPYVEKHYHVSASPADRAFSGLSAGGIVTNMLMLHDTEKFGYYGMMSAGFPPGTLLSGAQIAALKNVSIFIGSGWQDPIHANGWGRNGVLRHTGPLREVGMLVDAGVPVTTSFVNGGHAWYVWRILLKDFVTRVAFLPPFAALP